MLHSTGKQWNKPWPSLFVHAQHANNWSIQHTSLTGYFNCSPLLTKSRKIWQWTSSPNCHSQTGKQQYGWLLTVLQKGHILLHFRLTTLLLLWPLFSATIIRCLLSHWCARNHQWSKNWWRTSATGNLYIILFVLKYQLCLGCNHVSLWVTEIQR